MDVEADETRENSTTQTGEAREKPTTQPSDTFIPQITVAIIYKGEICHSFLRQILEESSHSANLRVYIQTKLAWGNDIFDLVDWKNFGKYLQTTKCTKKQT